MKTLQKGIVIFLACFFMTGVFAATAAAPAAAVTPATQSANPVLAMHKHEGNNSAEQAKAAHHKYCTKCSKNCKKPPCKKHHKHTRKH